jgi:AcrR family transcriptional regulator
MRSDFFDRYAVFTKSISASLRVGDETGNLAAIGSSLASYYARGKNDLLFAFALLLGEKDPEKLFLEELASRGLSPILLSFWSPTAAVNRTRFQFAVGSCFFSVLVFHALRPNAGPPGETDIAMAGENARNLIQRGLGFGVESLRNLDYATLEGLARADRSETGGGDGLLAAVASAVAEAGPWNASMELVARRSGLSKSGLYAHFKSREEMMATLFTVEFDRIAALMENRIARGTTGAERVFLAMASAASYLSARPDILSALDWIRVQRIDLGVLMPPRFVALFSFLEAEPENPFAGFHAKRLELASRWILFHIINFLIHSRACGADPQVLQAEERLRELHRCVCVGLSETVQGVTV